jgi:hypothetical protein
MVIVLEEKDSIYDEAFEESNQFYLEDEDPSTTDSLYSRGFNPNAPYMQRMSGDGSNSVSDETFDENSFTSDDGRNNARTYFNPDEVGETPLNYSRLYKINEGERVNDGKRRGRNRSADRKRDVDTVATKLRLNDTQRRWIKMVIEDFDFNGIKFEKIMLAATASVCEKYNRDVTSEESFEELTGVYDVSMGRVNYYQEKLEDESQHL